MHGRYRRQGVARGGFGSIAQREGAVIVPTAGVGAEEVHPVLYESRFASRLLGIPALVTPTFPHLGVLGLGSSYGAPTEGQRLDLIRMEEELDGLMQRIGDFLILNINRFARRVYAAGVEASFFIGPIG